MNQPELGKKIAEQRKSKRFTQEELAEKSKLNIRTLQRIESGEVKPRAYTLKMILSVLDYESYDLLEISNTKPSYIIWLKQLLKYIPELFNLKTDTMKKLTILTIILSGIVFGVFLINDKVSAQDGENIEQTNTTTTDDDQVKPITFMNISCEECFGIGKEETLVGRDVNFEINGVKAKFSLLSLNKNTREFQGSFHGKLLLDKVELSYPYEMIRNGKVEYCADNIQENDEEIILIGSAKIESRNSWIETNEIVIALN